MGILHVGFVSRALSIVSSTLRRGRFARRCNDRGDGHFHRRCGQERGRPSRPVRETRGHVGETPKGTFWLCTNFIIHFLTRLPSATLAVVRRAPIWLHLDLGLLLVRRRWINPKTQNAYDHHHHTPPHIMSTVESKFWQVGRTRVENVNTENDD
jgi:hypothetical protein